LFCCISLVWYNQHPEPLSHGTRRAAAALSPGRAPRGAREARLYVCGNGQGSPCLDLRRVPDTLADATVGADLVVVEGMGRAIHTNYRCAARRRWTLQHPTGLIAWPRSVRVAWSEFAGEGCTTAGYLLVHFLFSFFWVQHECGRHSCWS
jgi:hypothetical protein